MKRYHSIISFIYISIIIYVWIQNNLKNFLAPNMQIYLKLSIIILFFMMIVSLFNNKINYKFKFSDLILLLPILFLILSGDAKLSMNLANNKRVITNTSIKEEDNNKEVNSEIQEEIKQEEIKYDFTKIDFDVKDSSYYDLSNYITFTNTSTKYIGSTIRVRGFTIKNQDYIPSGYFSIGKYNISCCAADAEFTGFYVKDKDNIKDNTWYEIEGVLEKLNDERGVLAIKIVNIKELNASEEEQYVYPCYAYDDGSCAEISKYDIEY